jgi:hypothetical protein
VRGFLLLFWAWVCALWRGMMIFKIVGNQRDSLHVERSYATFL